MVDTKLKKFKRAALSSAVAGLLLLPGLAQAFIVEKIEVEGANRIGFETINSYLSISKGKFLDSRLTQESIQRLYKTGFFQDVALYQKESGTLVIKVVERPSISDVTIKGNQLIETSVLKDALDGLGIKKGRIYNQVEMDKVIVDLKRRYQNQGYYAAEVEIISEDLPRNRVALNIKIVEGEPASIGRITLVGNKIYSDERLKSKMQMAEGDAYSKPKLQADIETVKSYYMDRGYAEFDVRSSQVSLSVDKTQVFTTINVTEGPQYSIAEIHLIGELIISEEEVNKLLNFKVNDTFSRGAVIEGVNAIRDRLSEEGYAFAEITPETNLDKESETIVLNFKFEPKNRVYIRRVVLEGNTRTRDHVIRREMRQLESAPYSLKEVRQSKSRLDRVGYFKSSDIETKRVSEDEVDLVVKVEEQATGSFTAGVGYSQLDGVSFNLGVSERNFIGSGNQLDFSVATSAARKSADIGITNPYFTDDGVSLGGGIYLSEIDANELEIADYTTNNFGIRTSIGYPLSEFSSLNYGLKLDSQELVCQNDRSTGKIAFKTCREHVEKYGKSSVSAIFSMGWGYNSTNSFYFPSKGQKTRLSFETVVPGTSDISYYKVYADESWYYPITKNLSLQLKGAFSYGNSFGDYQDGLPFYERFYAGGIGSVRGFEPNSLGGYYNYATEGSDRPKGGDVKIATTAALLLPVPFIEDSSNIRISLFVDAGNVYTGINNIEVDELRSAAGIGFSWITPVGPLSFSFSQPIKYTSSDETQSFQFSLGAGF